MDNAKAVLTLADRMKAVIDLQTDKRGKFSQLEEMTGIPAEHWKSFYYSRQRPNPDMIEACCTLWSDYALWIATGEDDEEFGHLSPLSSSLEVSVGPYLKSSMQEKQIARALLYKKYEIPENSTDHEQEKAVVEKFMASAQMLIKPEDDPAGAYKSARTRKALEQEKRRLDVSRLSQAERDLLSSTKGYPFINKESFIAAASAFLAQAERDRSEAQQEKNSIEIALEEEMKKYR